MKRLLFNPENPFLGGSARMGLLTGLALVFLIGCGGIGYQQRTVYSGTVKMQGQPEMPLSVTYDPTTNAVGASIQVQGVYTVETSGTGYALQRIGIGSMDSIRMIEKGSDARSTETPNAKSKSAIQISVEETRDGLNDVVTKIKKPDVPGDSFATVENPGE